MIILPRPEPHLPRTIAALQKAGFGSLHALALSHPQPIPVVVPASATALIFTSIFAVHGHINGNTQLPAYCVGETTAIAARNAGYNVVYTGSNNGATMAKAITQHQAPGTRHHFIHLHGDHAGMLWHTTLRQAGHAVTPVQTYQTRRIQNLPTENHTAFEAANPHTLTLLFSAGSASHLAKLCKRANIPLVGTAIALSPAVTKAAARHWPHTATATAPTLEGMIQTLHALNTEH